MKRAVFLVALALAAVGIPAGCNSPQRAAVSGLAVELVSIERTGDSGATATVRIRNPNVVAYNVAKAEHRIQLDGRPVGVVTISEPTGVPAQSSVAQQTGVLKLANGVTLPGGPAQYRMDSELLLRLWGDSTQELKLNASGTVPVR